MSRCYPYPPPGYQKKAQLSDVIVPAKVFPKEKKKSKEKENQKDKEKEKKGKDLEKATKSKEVDKEEKKETTGEKAKHKDRRDKNKREKRKKDGETNGIGHDKDPRSSKLQRTQRLNNVLHSSEENGRVRETTISAAFANPVDRDGRGAATPRDSVEELNSHPPSMYIKKEQQSNGKVDSNAPPLVLSKRPGGSPPDVEAAPSTRPSNHSHPIESSQRPNLDTQRPDFSICDNLPPLASLSTTEDQDWLLKSSERPHSKPKAGVEGSTPQEVWAEAVYLPAVDMYALPYVVPY